MEERCFLWCFLVSFLSLSLLPGAFMRILCLVVSVSSFLSVLLQLAVSHSLSLFFVSFPLSCSCFSDLIVVLDHSHFSVCGNRQTNALCSLLPVCYFPLFHFHISVTCISPYHLLLFCSNVRLVLILTSKRRLTESSALISLWSLFSVSGCLSHAALCLSWSPNFNYRFRFPLPPPSHLPSPNFQSPRAQS